ncbi:MAG: hypothetical protein WA324_19425 [Bryobacteraceae bacterium]
MMLILPVIAYVLWFAVFQLRYQSRREAALVGATWWTLELVLVTETLSLFRAVAPNTLAIAWLCGSLVPAALLVAVKRGYTQRALDVPRQSFRTSLRMLRGADWLMIAGILLISVLVGITAAVSPPNGSDQLQYHLPRVAEWASRHSISFFPTHYYVQLFAPPLAEWMMLQSYVLTGGDHYVGLVQWLAFLGSALTVSLIAKELGAKPPSAKGTAACHQTGEELATSSGGTLDPVPVLRVFPRSAKGTAACHHAGEEPASSSGGALDPVPVLRTFPRSQLLSAFLCVTLPQGILAASGAKNDWVLGFWLSAAVLFLLRWNRDPGWLSSCNLGLAVGAALLTKGSVYPFLLPLVTAIFIWSIRPKRKFLLQAMPVAAAAIIVMNGPQWTRNYSLGGSIIGLSAPDVAGKEKYTVDRFSVAGIASNVIREAGMHLGTPIDSLNQRETNALRKIIVLMGVDPDDPALTNYSRFEIPHAYFIRDEYYAGNPLHLALALLTFGALLLIRKARSPANLTIAIGVTAAFILYCALFKWEIWCARLHLPLFVISSAVVAVVLCRTFPKLVLPVTIAALLLAIPPALLNETRPLLFSGGFHNLSTNRTSIFLRSRPELYFTQQSQLKATYLPAAQAIRDEKCDDIGFDTSVRPYAHEYPLIELGKATNEEPSFRYVDVHNLSSKYADASDHRSPCLVVCPDCRDRSDKWKEYLPVLPATKTFGTLVIFSRTAPEAVAHVSQAH